MSVEIPKIETLTQPVKTTITEADRRALYDMVQRPGYRVLLKLMEMKCVLQDHALMTTDPADEKRVVAEHRVGLAKWGFFGEVQSQVEFEINELFGATPDPREDNVNEILATEMDS